MWSAAHEKAALLLLLMKKIMSAPGALQVLVTKIVTAPGALQVWLRNVAIPSLAGAFQSTVPSCVRCHIVPSRKLVLSSPTRMPSLAPIVDKQIFGHVTSYTG